MDMDIERSFFSERKRNETDELLETKNGRFESREKKDKEEK